MEEVFIRRIMRLCQISALIIDVRVTLAATAMAASAKAYRSPMTITDMSAGLSGSEPHAAAQKEAAPCENEIGL